MRWSCTFAAAGNEEVVRLETRVVLRQCRAQLLPNLVSHAQEAT